jgi:hypothetical protein
MYLLPPPSPNQNITILEADPLRDAFFTPVEAEEIKRTHPHVKTKLVKGAAHGMIWEVLHRDVVIQEALEMDT